MNWEVTVWEFVETVFGNKCQRLQHFDLQTESAVWSVINRPSVVKFETIRRLPPRMGVVTKNDS